MSRLSFSSSSMISIARTFGAPDRVPAGKPADSASTHRGRAAARPRHWRDVHHVAVPLDDEAVGHLHRADLGDAADVVAAEVEQHQMLGALLRVGEQFGAERRVLLGRLRRAGACPRSGGSTTLPSRRRTRISGLEPTIGKPPKSRKNRERRGIDPPQRAIERERRQLEAAGEALRQHDLERVAGDDVVLRRRPSRGTRPRWCSRPPSASKVGSTAGAT